MQTVPEGKVISAFPHLQSDQELGLMEKEALAFDLIVKLVEMFERQGYQVPQLPAGYSAVRQEEIPLPAPDQIPAGVNDKVKGYQGALEEMRLRMGKLFTPMPSNFCPGVIFPSITRFVPNVALK